MKRHVTTQSSFMEVFLFARFLISGIVALLPAAALAQSVADTHKPVFVPGKTIHAYKPVEQSRKAPAKCHPDTGKAVACEALRQHARLKQLEQSREAEAIKLGNR